MESHTIHLHSLEAQNAAVNLSLICATKLSAAEIAAASGSCKTPLPQRV
jgi:hypothetical protein